MFLIVESNTWIAEIAAILMESDAFDYLDAPMERITGADVPMPYAIPLEKACLPQSQSVFLSGLWSSLKLFQ
jgi:pyruvate dehydrogenase E1 component beta subunit